MATPPCLPSAGDQKLLPDHFDLKDATISGRAARVSCKQTKSDLEFFAKSKIQFSLASLPRPRTFKVDNLALNSAMEVR